MLAQERADLISKMEAEVEDERRRAEYNRERQARQTESGRGRTGPDAKLELTEQSEHLRAVVKRLRKIPRGDIAALDEALGTFVLRECSGGDLGVRLTLKTTEIFIDWLKKMSFRCKNCGNSFFPVRTLHGGRPRSTCSDSCRSAARR
jgi:hypothetical protein